MRLTTAVLASILLAGSVSFAAPKGGKHKQFHKMCKEENPDASRADLKKCVKEKVKESKRK